MNSGLGCSIVRGAVVENIIHNFGALEGERLVLFVGKTPDGFRLRVAVEVQAGVGGWLGREALGGYVIWPSAVVVVGVPRIGGGQNGNLCLWRGWRPDPRERE